MSKFYIKKQYKTTNSVIVPDFVDAEQAFHLASAPESDMGWIIIAPWTTNEETCFFHRTVGNTVYVHWVNRSNPNIHAIGTIVYYASTIDYLNYLLSRQNHQMYIYKTSDDNVVVLGWEFYVWGIYTTVPDMDTSLGLPNQTLLVNSTSWIHLVNGVYTILPTRNNAHYYVGNVITDIAGVITEINLANVTHLSIKWDQWDPGPIGPTGPAGVNYRWTYGPWVTYAPHDVVLFNWQLYINILGSTWSDPSNATNWNLFLPKSDLTLWLVEDKFIDVTSSVFPLTQTPFNSSVVFVFIRQRKGILWVDYTYSSITNTVTLLPAAISANPQTVEILYAISWVEGSGWSDHLVWSDVTDTVPWTLFDKMLVQWDLTVSTLEPSPGDVKILISAPERTYTSIDNSVAITLTETTDVQWLIHKNVDLSVVWGGGGWATSTTINWLNFALADELTISSTDTSVGIATTQDVDGDININLSVPSPNTNINGLTFDLTDSLNVTSADSSVTITPTQNPAGDVTLDLSVAATSTTVNGLTFDFADTLTITSNDLSATVSASQGPTGNVAIDISVPSASTIWTTSTTYVAGTNISAWKPVFVWVDGKAYLTGTNYVGISTNNAVIDANVNVWHIGTYSLGWFNIGDSIYLWTSNTWSGKVSMPTPRAFTSWAAVNNKIYVIGWSLSWSQTNVNEEYNPATNTWASKAWMPTARTSHCVIAANSKIYAIGWYASWSGFLTANEEYNPSTNVWVSKASMFTARDTAAIATVNNKIYVIGGNGGPSGWVPQTANEEYDVFTDTWTSKAAFPNPRWGGRAWDANGKIYVFGGYNGVSVLGINQEYNPVSDTWTTKSSMWSPRYLFAATSFNGKIYAIGDWQTNEEYNPLTNTWTYKALMPTGRIWLALVAANGKIYAIGWSTTLGTNEEYDPLTDSWSKKTSMTTARVDFWVAVVDSKIYCIGWFNGAYTGVNEEYNPYTNSWTTKASMLTARYALTASVVDNKIYCIGWSNSSYVGNNEEYNPSTNTWSVKSIMPTARNAAAAAVYNGKIYVIGWTNWLALNINQRFDPIANSWTTLNPMITARFWLIASNVADKIYCIGGYNGSLLNTNQEYNIALDIWFNKSSMPTSRYAFCSAVVEDNIYCIGWDNGSVTGNNEKYDPVLNTWTSLSSLPTPRSFLGAGVVDNKIYTIGWTTTWSVASATGVNEMFDLSPSYVSSWSDKLWSIVNTGTVLFFKI